MGGSGKKLTRVPRRCHELRPAIGVSICEKRMLECMEACSESCNGELTEKLRQVNRIRFAHKEDHFGRFLKLPYEW